MLQTSRLMLVCCVALLAACHSPEPTRAASPRATAPAASAPSPPAPAWRVAAGITDLERVTGTADPDARLPLVVAMHGLGDTPEAFLHVLDGLDTRARVVSLRGLDAWGPGWSWFQPGLDPASPAFASALERAAHRVAAAINEIAHTRPTCGHLVVIGFSQGAMLADTLAAREVGLRALYLPVAGRLGATIDVVPGPRDVSIHALHGRADTRVPIDDAISTNARFVAAGIPAQLDPYPDTGHTISAAMDRDLLRLVHDAVASGCDVAPAR